LDRRNLLAALDADWRTVSKRRLEEDAHSVSLRVRLAVDAGMIEACPSASDSTRRAKKTVRPFHRDDLDAILAKSSPNAR